jgi:AmmeMemoRadiSam system protein B
MPSTRRAAVSGLFYSADSSQLASDVRHFLDQANPQTLGAKALIVPHAGYVYSGSVAAQGYATLRDVAETIRRVVLLGPTHRVAVRGLVHPGVEYFETPLGAVLVDPIDTGGIDALCQVTVNAGAHTMEHSLEVQLPFLQTLLPNFTLLPLAVGIASAADVAEVLEAVWGTEETLIVISSDLSHYHPYETAKALDRHTAEAILEMRLPLSHESACGATPISGLIEVARRRHLIPRLLDLRNSGDTAGRRDKVVGYASIAFAEACADVRH